MKGIKDGPRNMLCEWCRGFFPISEVAYFPKGNSKIALCKACREKGTKDKSILNEEEDYEEVKKKTSKISKDSYYCRRCKYKFRFAPVNETKLKCPYCGREDTVIER